MLVKEALHSAAASLAEFSKTPMLDARALLCLTLECSHDQLISCYNIPLSDAQTARFFGYIERRLQYEPIAYIRGSQEFYSLDFVVNPSVLIPRPETELLVDAALEVIDNGPTNILELGCGSGAISIALAKNASQTSLTAVDIDPKALQTAQQNAQLHQVTAQINFIKSDWYNNIKQQKFRLIISNPPYIAPEETEIVSESTHKFEPHLALYANNQGLECYQKIISGAQQYLDEQGIILLEIGCNQAQQVGDLLRQYGFKNICVTQDYAGLDRIVKASVAER